MFLIFWIWKCFMRFVGKSSEGVSHKTGRFWL